MSNEWDVKSVEWALTPQSVVFEVGGYKGRWAKLIQDRYHPRLYVFEPQAWAYRECVATLDEKAHVFNYALGIEDATLTMREYHTDGCSFVRATRESGEGALREYFSVLQALDVSTIDLMLMNIEGYEFKLLPHIITGNGMTNIKNFMIQFHPANTEQTIDFLNLCFAMQKTHNLLWDYGTTLSAWERK